MDEAPPPPTEHTLRPHHLVLLSILMIAFKDLREINLLPPEFATHLLRVLLDEISEVTEPLSHRDLMLAFSSGPGGTSKEANRFIAAINTVHGETYSTEKIGNFLGNLPSLFVEKMLEEKPRLMRRSIFGYFCRRCFISFVKLSYAEVCQLRIDYVAWCQGQAIPFTTIPKEDLTTRHLLLKTSTDRKSYATAEAYEAWELARAVGDESVAVENIRRFFEQHFHDHSDSGYRQHALLNVVHMHYLNQEYVAAGKLLHEAIGVARTANDRPTLQHCLSLLRRLPQPPGGKPFINEIQPDMHPLEVLFDVKKLLDEENEQPISQAFNKIVEAIGLYDHWLDSQAAIPDQNHQWSQHAVQSIVWRELGCESLAQSSEDIVLQLTPPATDNSTRLAVVLNRAYYMARQGDVSTALESLFNPLTWLNLTIVDYQCWAHEVWSIVAMRAVRRGQNRLYREYLLPRKPPGEGSSRNYTFEPSKDRLSPIRQSLHEVLRMKNCDEIHNAVNPLLNALWQSEFLGRFHSYRTAVLLLADFGLQYGMPKRSKRLVGEILPQVVHEKNDREQRAVAYFTMARCLLAAEGRSPPVLKQALTYLRRAQADFSCLEMASSAEDVTYFKAIIYDALGDKEARDAQTLKLEQLEAVRKEREVQVLDEEVQQICETIASVGAYLAGRTST